MLECEINSVSLCGVSMLEMDRCKLVSEQRIKLIKALLPHFDIIRREDARASVQSAGPTRTID